MTKKEKIKSLAIAMTRSSRKDDPEEEFYHFTDTAPEELKDKFLEHFEVRDTHYEIFSKACDIMAEIYGKEHKVSGKMLQEVIEGNIYDRSADSASVSTTDRLGYLDMWNEEEVSQIMREYGEYSIATACAIWYDKQVEQACFIIKDWIEQNND